MVERPWIDISSGKVILRLRVQPGARTRGVVGIADRRLKVRVTEKPTAGGANEAVVRLVAEVAAVARSAVVITRGLASREKSVAISAPDPQAVVERLRQAVGDCPDRRRQSAETD